MLKLKNSKNILHIRKYNICSHTNMALALLTAYIGDFHLICDHKSLANQSGNQ